MQYNYHCNQVVILNLELVQFWLFLAAFGTPMTRSFPIKKNTKYLSIYPSIFTIYNIIWGIVFPEYFNEKLFLFVDLYLSPDKLAKKIYYSGRFYICTSQAWQFHTPVIWFLFYLSFLIGLNIYFKHFHYNVYN
jgi:hypothetical protein